MSEPRIPRRDYVLADKDGNDVGRVTSGGSNALSSRNNSCRTPSILCLTTKPLANTSRSIPEQKCLPTADSTIARTDPDAPKHKGISFLLFVLFYLPCVAVIATVGRESGSWKWAGFVLFYTTAIAWLASFLVYQVGTVLQLG